MAHRQTTFPLLLVALLLPTAGAFTYFVLLAESPAARTVYFASKAVQFALPLLFVAATLAGAPRPRTSAGRAAGVGLASGLVFGLGVWPAYVASVRGSAAEAAIAETIGTKMTDFGIDRPAAYLAMSLFLSLLHSGLEEYYWRWFVFGSLRQRFGATRSGLGLAVVVSSLGFMAHHVIVIHQFLAGGPNAWMVVPASLAVAFGGAVWALLYVRTGRLLAPWLSHVLADVGIMALGYEMIWGF